MPKTIQNEYLSPNEHKAILDSSFYYIQKLKVNSSKDTIGNKELLQQLTAAVEAITLIPFRDFINKLPEKFQNSILYCTQVYQIINWNENSAQSFNREKILLLVDVVINCEKAIIKLNENNNNRQIEREIQEYQFTADILKICLRDSELYQFIDFAKFDELYKGSSDVIRKLVMQLINRPAIVQYNHQLGLPQSNIPTLLTKIRDKIIARADVYAASKIEQNNKHFSFFQAATQKFIFKLQAFNELYINEQEKHYTKILQDYAKILVEILEKDKINQRDLDIIFSIYNKISELLLNKYIKVSRDENQNSNFSFGVVRAIRNSLVHSLDNSDDYSRMIEIFIGDTQRAKPFISLILDLISSILEIDEPYLSINKEKLVKDFNLLQSIIDKESIIENDSAVDLLKMLSLFQIKFDTVIEAVNINYNESSLVTSLYLDYNVECLGEIAGAILGKDNEPGKLFRFQNELISFELFKEELAYDSRIEEFVYGTLAMVVNFRNQISHSMTQAGYKGFINLLTNQKSYINEMIQETSQRIQEIKRYESLPRKR